MGFKKWSTVDECRTTYFAIHHFGGSLQNLQNGLKNESINLQHLFPTLKDDSVVAMKGQKWITQRDVRYTAVYIYRNTVSNGYQ